MVAEYILKQSFAKSCSSIDELVVKLCKELHPADGVRLICESTRKYCLIVGEEWAENNFYVSDEVMSLIDIFVLGTDDDGWWKMATNAVVCKYTNAVAICPKGEMPDFPLVDTYSVITPSGTHWELLSCNKEV